MSDEPEDKKAFMERHEIACAIRKRLIDESVEAETFLRHFLADAPALNNPRMQALIGEERRKLLMARKPKKEKP